MTGFPRHARSYYLDDMDVGEGAEVRCKCAMGSPYFTAGKAYRVLPGGTVIDDMGQRVVPSVRFTITQL